jgi:ABC-type transport system involved in multi-copper enzyme maturation permease subunit
LPANFCAPTLSPATEIALVFRRELRRNVRSAKGIALGVLTVLGAIVSALVCASIEGSERAHTTDAADYVELKRAAILSVTGDASLADSLAKAPSSLLLFLKINIWLAPLLVALLGFDTVAGDLQNRTVRYWTPRTRRSSYFTGKLLGLWATVAVATLCIHALADGVALTRGYIGWSDLPTWGARFWMVGVVIAGAWVAVATLLSASMRSPAGALLTTFAAFFALWIAGVVGGLSRVSRSVAGEASSPMRWFEYLYPNSYDALLLSPDATRLLAGAGALLGFVALAIVAGSAMFEARDV